MRSDVPGGRSAPAPSPAGSLAHGLDRLGLPRALSILIVMACLVLVMAGTKQVGAIVGPAFFALNLVITAQPLQKWMLRHRVPRPLVILAIMLLLYAVLLAVFGLLGIALVRTAYELPRYGSQFIALFDNFVDWLESLGISQTQLLDQFQTSIDFGRVLSLTQMLLGFVSSFSTQLVFILVALFFLILDTGDTRRRLKLFMSLRPDLARALSGFATSVRRYWVVNTIFGLIVAVIDYVGLVMIGVPLAFTWGILAFVTNFIPNIGFVIGLVPPALVALLEGGVSDMVAVIVLYCVANFVLQTLIQPKFTSDAVGVNTSTTFMSLAFWTYIIGPLGALIAVPMTLFFKAVLIDADPGSRWANAFISSEDAVDHPAASGQPDQPEDPGPPENPAHPDPPDQPDPPDRPEEPAQPEDPGQPEPGSRGAPERTAALE